MSKIWLVTGAARGLGRAIVEAALAAGDNVVAAARNPGRLSDLEQQYVGKLRTFDLDVTDAVAATAAVAFTVDTFGRLDVLVNNAGYGHVAPFEQASLADFQAQISTNLYGVVNLAHAAMPVMRAQRAGHIINISSAAGRVAIPGMAAYTAAKWAVSGFTEVLAIEGASLGIKVIAIEPGGIRTDWGTNAATQEITVMPDYQETVGAVRGGIAAGAGYEVSDPQRIARIVVDLSRKDQVPAHLLMGSDALYYLSFAEGGRQKAAEEWKEVSLSTNFPDADLSRFGG